MKLRNFDWDHEDDFQAAFKPRKQNKIKKMKKTSKTNNRENSNLFTESED